MKSYHEDPVNDSTHDAVGEFTNQLADGKYIGRVDATRGLSNEDSCEREKNEKNESRRKMQHTSVHDEERFDLGHDEGWKDNNPESDHGK